MQKSSHCRCIWYYKNITAMDEPVPFAATKSDTTADVI